jgi:hypothetical protein
MCRADLSELARWGRIMTRRRYGDSDDRPRESGGPWVLLGFGLVGLVLLTAAGAALWYFTGTRDTNAIVLERYRERFAEQRAALKRIADALPAPGTVRADALPADLDPKPVFDTGNQTFNTALLMAAYCDDPDRKLTAPGEVDLFVVEDKFRTHLLWTGDRSPMAESARKAPAQADLVPQLERSLALRYLVVPRPVRYDPPRATGDKAFAGGELDLEVFLVELRTEKVLGATRRTFRPDPQVMVTFRRDGNANESAEAFVYSNLMDKVRTEVPAALARGGSQATGPNRRARPWRTCVSS